MSRFYHSGVVDVCYLECDDCGREYEIESWCDEHTNDFCIENNIKDKELKDKEFEDVCDECQKKEI